MRYACRALSFLPLPSVSCEIWDFALSPPCHSSPTACCLSTSSSSLLFACGLLWKVDMLPAWLKVFSACLLFCAPSIWLHTHTYTHTLTRRLMYVSWLTRFYWPSCLLVFCTLSNFDGLGRVSFPSAFFRGNLIYACKSSWQAALRSLGKLKSSARVFVRMLIVCLASRLSREQLYSETYSQLPISLCLPCKAEEHVFQLASPVFVYFLVYLSTAWQFYRFTCMHEFQYAFFRILFRLGQQRRKSDNKHKEANNVDGSG